MATRHAQPPPARRGREEEIDWFAIGRFLTFSWPALIGAAVIAFGLLALHGGDRTLAGGALAAFVIASAVIPVTRRSWCWVWQHSWGSLSARIRWERVCEAHRWTPAKVASLQFGQGFVRFSARIPQRESASSVMASSSEIAALLEAEHVVIRDGDRPGWVEVVITR